AGKGIYDVDAFEAALDGRVRENTLLSHDLFEGTFARAGLASDIELVEEFPSRYDVAAARQHRWVRGDWQLLPWILGRGDASVADRSASDHERASALPSIGRWKMLDNLRRSLSAPASVAALLAGWALPLHAAVVWTGFVLSTIALSTLLPVLAGIVPRRARITARSHLRALAADVGLASPAIARWTSLSPLVAGRLSVSDADARALRLVARRAWRFFETFVTAEDHMLPPDNFQEDPKPVVAHRTSPTNLGLYLLSAVSARDFGWAGTTETVDRLEATLATMGRLQRFRGHFYNWYDTRDLRPLDPQYISSVDSGNLAGHLIALAIACREWIRRPQAGPESLAAIEDGLNLTS